MEEPGCFCFPWQRFSSAWKQRSVGSGCVHRPHILHGSLLGPSASHHCPCFLTCSLLPGGSDSKESACNEGDLASIPGSGRSPGGGHSNPIQYSYLENSKGQRSLAGYSAWSRNERLSTAQHRRAKDARMSQARGRERLQGTLPRKITSDT